MKPIITRLSIILAIVSAMAAVGCTDYAADIQALDKKVEALSSETQKLAEEINALKASLETTYATKAELNALTVSVTSIQKSITAIEGKMADKATVDAALAAIEADIKKLKGLFGDTEEGDVPLELKPVYDLIAGLEDMVENLRTVETPEAIKEAVTPVKEALTELTGSFEAYVKATDETLAAIKGQIAKLDETIATLATSEEVVAKVAALKEELLKAMADADAILAGDIEKLGETLTGIETAFKAADEGINAEILALKAAIEKLNSELASKEDTQLLADAITALTNEVSGIKTTIASLDERLVYVEAQIKVINLAIASLTQDSTTLKGMVLVPQTFANGIKAVRFASLPEDEVKTYATVTYHFNPSTFKIMDDNGNLTVDFEIATSQAEILTKAADPAIKILSVSQDEETGDVTFELERRGGEGNMFAIKATPKDGKPVLHSDYAAILDELHYYYVEGTATVDFQRIALQMPSLSDLGSLIDALKDYQESPDLTASAVESIQKAIEAMKNGNTADAFDNLSSLGIFKKETITITGNGSARVDVETMTAASLFDDLKNVETLNELMGSLDRILQTAKDHFGEDNAIVNGIDGIINGVIPGMGNMNLGDLIENLDNLPFLDWIDKIPGLEYTPSVNELTDMVIDYIINNSGLGEYIEQMEDKMNETGYAAKKTVALATAKYKALDRSMADVIKKWEAKNERVTEEFNNSLFGKFLNLIKSTDASAAFDQVGLGTLYDALMLFAEVAQYTNNYYPTVDFQSLLPDMDALLDGGNFDELSEFYQLSEPVYGTDWMFAE